MHSIFNQRIQLVKLCLEVIIHLIISYVTFPVLPEAFFRPPYFDPKAPFYVNLASTGIAFAHEIAHAFDFTGK